MFWSRWSCAIRQRRCVCIFVAMPPPLRRRYTDISKPRVAPTAFRRNGHDESPAEHCPSAYATSRSPAPTMFAVATPASAIRPDLGTRSARVVAKVEWHPGELVPRVGFIVTNLSRPTKRVVAYYNHRGTAEQHIKEGKNAINWTRLSCRKFCNNAVRLRLHALAYNLCNCMRTLKSLPKEVEHWLDYDVARQAGEDRGQGCTTWPLRYVPIG